MIQKKEAVWKEALRGASFSFGFIYRKTGKKRTEMGQARNCCFK